jgi:hypothetical protein
MSDDRGEVHYTNYTIQECFYINVLVRNKVLLNLVDYKDVTEYVSKCADPIFSAYKNGFLFDNWKKIM